MAKVYRAVPILSSTIYRKKGLNNYNISLEKEFYNMGFIDFEDSALFFRTSEDKCNTFDCVREREKSFFLFPIDAIYSTFTSINRMYYSCCEWEVLEFDIPDEILLEYCGYGFYNEIARIEFRIPMSVFQNNSLQPERKFDNETLIKKIIDSNNEYIEKFKITKENKELADLLVEKMPIFAQKAINSKREYVDSPFITNKSFSVSANEIYHQETSQYLTDEEKLILLKSKINFSNDIIKIWREIEKSSYSVYREWRYSKENVKKELQTLLKQIMPKLANIEKDTSCVREHNLIRIDSSFEEEKIDLLAVPNNRTFVVTTEKAEELKNSKSTPKIKY